jgi:diacylglycerol kinase (ATP)
MALVMCAEMLNTALERLCDMVCPQYSDFIRHSKDVAAGGVLVACLFAAAAGLVVFLRPEPLARLWELALGRPWLALLPAAMLAVSILFVRGSRREKPPKDAP